MTYYEDDGPDKWPWLRVPPTPRTTPQTADATYYNRPPTRIDLAGGVDAYMKQQQLIAERERREAEERYRRNQPQIGPPKYSREYQDRLNRQAELNRLAQQQVDASIFQAASPGYVDMNTVTKGMSAGFQGAFFMAEPVATLTAIGLYEGANHAPQLFGAPTLEQTATNALENAGVKSSTAENAVMLGFPMLFGFRGRGPRLGFNLEPMMARNAKRLNVSTEPYYRVLVNNTQNTPQGNRVASVEAALADLKNSGLVRGSTMYDWNPNRLAFFSQNRLSSSVHPGEVVIQPRANRGLEFQDAMNLEFPGSSQVHQGFTLNPTGADNFIYHLRTQNGIKTFGSSSELLKYYNKHSKSFTNTPYQRSIIDLPYSPFKTIFGKNKFTSSMDLGYQGYSILNAGTNVLQRHTDENDTSSTASKLTKDAFDLMGVTTPLLRKTLAPTSILGRTAVNTPWYTSKVSTTLHQNQTQEKQKEELEQQLIQQQYENFYDNEGGDILLNW